MTQVGRYQKVEFRLAVPGNYSNPFDPDEIDVRVRLTAPGGQQITIPAFYSQEYERRRIGPAGRQRDWIYPRGTPVWKARFAPMGTGAYEAVAILKNRSGQTASAPCGFNCISSDSKGFIRISRKDPRFLEFSDGHPFFAIGQNLAFIGSQQYVTLSKAEAIFSQLAANGANYLRIWTCCEDWAMAIEARKSAWGRSWDWHPPIAPLPDTESAARQCLKLSASRARLSVSPSHPVALRPKTRYAFTGRARAEENAELRVTLRQSIEDRLISAAPDVWNDFRLEFETGPGESWLEPPAIRLQGSGSGWIDKLSLKEIGGGPELLWEADVNRPLRGFYNPVDCFMLDEILAAAEKDGIYLQLCLLTRDLYMGALKDPESPEYGRAIGDAKKFFRYAVARWGYSTSVAAWEYWNEMNPGLPTDRFYSALGDCLEQIDPYHHLRTTSTWGPSAKDCRHENLDVADVHFYLRPSDKGRLRDEVDAVLERTRWLREQAPSKPAHLGEFGLANEKWQPTEEMKQSKELVDVHNAVWASALSGASGTAMFWWWERLDQRGASPLYRPLASFIQDVPWNSGAVEAAPVNTADERLRIVGLRAERQAWLWLFNQASSWSKIVIEQRAPTEIPDASFELKQPAGNYRIEWFDTRSGQRIQEERRGTADGILHLKAPPFSHDIACKVSG